PPLHLRVRRWRPLHGHVRTDPRSDGHAHRGGAVRTRGPVLAVHLSVGWRGAQVVSGPPRVREAPVRFSRRGRRTLPVARFPARGAFHQAVGIFLVGWAPLLAAPQLPYVPSLPELRPDSHIQPPER